MCKQHILWYVQTLYSQKWDGPRWPWLLTSDHPHYHPKFNQFILESEYTIVPKLKKFGQGVTKILRWQEWTTTRHRGTTKGLPLKFAATFTTVQENQPKKGQSKTHERLTLVTLTSSLSLTPGYFWRAHQSAPAQRQIRRFLRKREVLAPKIPSIFITAVFMESIKPSNQSLLAHTSILFAALQAFEWLHFHSTQVPWSTYSIFYPLYMLMMIMAGLVLFFCLILYQNESIG